MNRNARRPQNGGGRFSTCPSLVWLLTGIAVLSVVVARYPRLPGSETVEAVSLHTARAANEPLPPGSDFTSPNEDNSTQNSVEELIRELQAEYESKNHLGLVDRHLAGIRTEDIAAILEVLKNDERRELAEDLNRRLIRRWAETNPQDVAAWLKNQPPGAQRAGSSEVLAIVWAGSNLSDAIDWGQSLADPSEHDQVLAAMANEAVRADPKRALQLAAALPADAGRDELICRAAMNWASGDAEAAVAWARQIPDENLRAKVLAGVAIAWAKQDPQSAAALAAVELPRGRIQDDAVVSIVQRWAQEQPELAAAWVAQFPEGELRTAAVENLATQWSLKDSAAARQWLAAHF